MRKIQFGLTVVTVYVGLLCTGMAGTANADSRFAYSNSGTVTGNINAMVFGDGLNGDLPNGDVVDNFIKMQAIGIGEGELTVRVKGPHGFNEIYNLELDPLVQRAITIKFTIGDSGSTGETSHRETSDSIVASLGFNTTGITSKFQLSASCSGSLTRCVVGLDSNSGNALPSVTADSSNFGPGYGRIRVGYILDVYQD